MVKKHETGSFFVSVFLDYIFDKLIAKENYI